MIYLDTSVAAAHILSEPEGPPASLWDEPLVSSRLLEYELWVRINSRGLHQSHGAAVRELLETVSLVELAPTVLGRITEPFSVPVRTLDAMHLSTLLFLRQRYPDLALATYDKRLAAAAKALQVRLAIQPPT